MLVLSHRSALEFWRLNRNALPDGLSSAAEASRTFDTVEGAPRIGDLRKALCAEPLSALSTPLELLSPARADRRATALATIRCMQTKLPDGALVRVAADEPFLVSTPEFCFVQMAHELSLWELIELGYMLSGMYPDAPEPLSTPARLAGFAADAKGVTGAKSARSAAKWVVENSLSTEETHIAMLAHLPRALGGMGTKAPLLGQTIEAPDAVMRMLGSRTCTPDLYWPNADIAVEYDGRSWPNRFARADYERRKRNAYRMMGMSLVCIGRDDFADPACIRARFDYVNHRCGKRLQAPNRKQKARQAALLAWLDQREK